MPNSVIVHIPNSEPIIGEVDQLPTPTDTMLVVSNPRYKDGKGLTFISAETIKVVWPMGSINFIEVLASEDEEEIFGFVRE